MKSDILKLGSLFIDTENKRVTKNGTKIKLRKKEYDLLEFMAINKNRVLNRLTILEYVWDYSASTETNTLEVHITALRRKIQDKLSLQRIQNVYGLGYTLSDSLAGDIRLFDRPFKVL